MNNRIALSLFVTCAFASSATSAYEPATHGLLTLRAFQISRLGSTTALQTNLGIDVYTVPQSTFKNALGASYLDTGVELRSRTAGTNHSNCQETRT
jgi:hypothetical protein